MNDKIKLLVNTLGSERVKLNEKLSHHTFSKIGGPAKYFYIATNQNELQRVLNLAYQLDIPIFVLGNGTKFLTSAQGIKGLVVKNRTSQIKIGGVKGKVSQKGLGIEEALVEVDSGVSLGKLNEFLKSQGLKEIINLNSLNATIGGSLQLDPNLDQTIQKIKVWEQGEILEIDFIDLKRIRQVVLSVVLKIWTA